jgi:predicted nuclease with TOPRIM domain
MQDIQELFNRIQVTKKQAKDIRSAYKDALSSSGEYVEINEKIKTLRERKKQIEASIKSDFSGEFTKLEDYKVDLESDNTMLSDAALTKLMKGETVQVVDEYNNTYEPQFNVKFKKT